MIPLFPKFKELELTDRLQVELFTKNFPPYSDFNFTSLWCWNTKNQLQISNLNSNLVVKFTDYLTGSSFYSFIGNNKVNETAIELLKLSKIEGIPQELRLIPEEVVHLIDTSVFEIKEDRDHFDYIFEINKLAVCEGPAYYRKRSEISRFLRDKKSIYTKNINFLDIKTKIEILKLNYGWLVNKKMKDPFLLAMNEIAAIDRLLNIKNSKIYIQGIFLKETLIAYSVNEVEDSNFATGHFYKAARYVGLFDYLMKESASFLAKLKVKFLNFEQDLGVTGLRKSKLSFRPSSFLRKYCIQSK